MNRPTTTTIHPVSDLGDLLQHSPAPPSADARPTERAMRVAEILSNSWLWIALGTVTVWGLS